MNQIDKNRYKIMVKGSCILMAIAFIAVLIATQNIFDALGVIFGNMTGILGFIWIIQMVENLKIDDKAKRKVMLSYAFRYLVYILIFVIGYYLGFNILTMLIGFLCMNFSIKICTILEERGKIN